MNFVVLACKIRVLQLSSQGYFSNLEKTQSAFQGSDGMCQVGKGEDQRLRESDKHGRLRPTRLEHQLGANGRAELPLSRQPKALGMLPCLDV